MKSTKSLLQFSYNKPYLKKTFIPKVNIFQSIKRPYHKTNFVFKEEEKEKNEVVIQTNGVPSFSSFVLPKSVPVLGTNQLLIPQSVTIIHDSHPLYYLNNNEYYGHFLKKEKFHDREESSSIDELETVGTLIFLRPTLPGMKYLYTLKQIQRIKADHKIGHHDQKKNLTLFHSSIEEFKLLPYNENDPYIKAQQSEFYSMIISISNLIERNENIRRAIEVVAKFQNYEIEFFISIIEKNPYKVHQLLSMNDYSKKLRAALLITKEFIEVKKIESSVKQMVEDKVAATQNNYFLNEKLKVIKRELGLEVDERVVLMKKYETRMKELILPPHAKTQITEEINRLKSLDPSSAEFNVSRNYLDWLTILPWGKHKKEIFDIKLSQKILDEDHYGMKKLKDRILEFIAIGKLKGSIKGKIVCFVGPPGVGKTSIGKSIAKALDREFFRFSVGGMTDVGEIKGHRRTYIGSMPGKVLQIMKLSKYENPVIMIDEIDKLSRGHGDPASALLEVLDPEQNNSFLDHYLDVPFDLSKILFICTANLTETIPKPLLDRMEVINVSGYIQEEKLHIAQQYLIPKVLKETGLKQNQFKLSDEILNKLIREYCRESGVRNLEKKISQLARKVALSLAKKNKIHQIDDKQLLEMLGLPKFSKEKHYDSTPVGVTTGLAYTEYGGSLMYIETIINPNDSGTFIVTGKLGDVMKESTSIAMTVAKNFLKKNQPENKFFQEKSIHLHFPEGATPKDGPSAGITITTALLSLAMNKKCNDIAMTGEITLTEKVLEIGGVKEKVIAARRSDMKEIIMPKSNMRHWEELEPEITKGITVHFVDYYQDVFDIIFK